MSNNHTTIISAIIFTIAIGTGIGCQRVTDIPSKWRNYQVTPEKAESDNLRGGPSLDIKPIPFGSLNKEWMKFKAKLVEGDELWHWTSESKFGYCIIRNKKTVSIFTYHDINKK